MERSAYYQLAAIEDMHWWFVYRRQLVAQMIDAFGGVHGEAALDIGCGTGGNLPFLRKYCATVSGLDLSEDAIALAREKFPQEDFHRGDVNELCNLYAAGSFDLISDFNVLYHDWVKSDLQSMRDIHKLLRPGGVFILTEPAFPFLRRAHDVVDLGVRRYRLGKLTEMLKRTGYRDARGTYFNLPALPLVLLLALAARLGLSPGGKAEGVGELKLPPEWLSDLLGAVLRVELGAIKTFGRVPLGVSIACIARKPFA
jgi:SAM-dependent methyltransferase